MSVAARVALGPGYSISRLLKGGWQLAGGHGAVDREAALADMQRFVSAGITTWDCADIYTGVEELIGEFLRRGRARSPGERPTVEVHTKYVPDLSALGMLTRDDVERSIDRSLARLGTERLDLVQFHWWDYDVPQYVEVGSWLHELQRRGKIRHIGVTNFDVPRLDELVAAGVPVVAHQVQFSLLDARPLRGMVEFCRAHGIQLLCYGALGGGFLSERWLGSGPPVEPLENRSLIKYRLIIDEFGGWELFQALLQVLHRVAERHGTGIGTVALRYVLDLPEVAGVIVGARHPRHLGATVAALDLVLDDEDRRAIAGVLGQARGPEGDTYTLERIKGGRHAGIMRYNLHAQRPE
jgi:aryl-alcohol dehydrogenase-like predicted oxidoreductase